MIHLTEDETAVLRDALGLSYWNRQDPQRNYCHRTDKTSTTIDGLVKRGFLKQDEVLGQGGREVYYKATDTGRVAVLDARWRD